jgi:HEAT repeat protein
VLADIGKNLNDARYCILPYANVTRLKMKNDVRGLIRLLTSEDLNVQYDAVEALGELADPVSVPALIHVLTKDRYSAVRWKAAESLVKIGEPSVEPLIVALSDPDEDVRWKAAIALGEIKDPRAIEPLLQLLTDSDNYVRSRAAYALGRIGQPSVIPLIHALNEGDEHLRWGAAIALGKIHDPRAIAPLIHALDDTCEHVRTEALASLEALEKDTVDTFITLLNAAGDQEVQDLVRMGTPEGVMQSPSLFIRIANADQHVRKRLQKTLEESNNPDLEPLIRDLRRYDD